MQFYPFSHCSLSEMINKTKYHIVPDLLIDLQKQRPLSYDLYLTECGEIEVAQDTLWRSLSNLEHYLLMYCTKGSGIIQISGDQISISSNQYIIIPPGEGFKFYSEMNVNTRFLVAYFNGIKAQNMEKEFALVRNLIPSVNNMVANREMLFDEIFNNLGKGYYEKNLEYVNFCFSHLLATFIYANKTSEDMDNESSPLVQNAINYLSKNLHKKLTLAKLAHEVGYSPTYLSTLFKKHTNYSPISYFSHLKVLKACEYLDYTKLKIKEISFKLGYTDPYYFTRDFTKKMGISPRNYRNRIN